MEKYVNEARKKACWHRSSSVFNELNYLLREGKNYLCLFLRHFYITKKLCVNHVSIVKV